MTDEDKEKAEKLAAAKKRFEELKKKQAKGNKKKGTKKEAATGDTPDDKVDDAANASSDPSNAVEGDDEQPADAADDPAEANDKLPTDEKNDHSTSIRSSKERSQSFKQGTKSPAPAVDASSEAQEIYRKQTIRIEELEKLNATLGKSDEDSSAKIKMLEEEIDTLKEGSSELAELKAKAALADSRSTEIEKLSSELASTQRQLSQAQQSVAKPRRVSVASPSADLKEQLASKTSAIESLELEMSNLRNQLAISESDKSSYDATIKSLETKVSALEKTSASASEELATLKKSMAETSNPDKTDTSSAHERKITLLESDLRSAQTSAETASQRASGLESKIETLTKLSRESATTTASRDKEIKDLKTRLEQFQTHRKDAAGEDIEDLEDEERERLQARIRDLEAETFELRRGVWRDKRQAMQPGMDGDEAPGYEDVDLNGTRRPSNTQHSTFQNVLQSGINAFTGKPTSNARPLGHDRKESLGLLSDDDDFDVDAYRQAQEEEGKRRIERMKEVKRGLEKWRGWRMDLVDLRAGGLGGSVQVGPIFEV